MLKLKHNRTYTSIIGILFFILVGGLLFVATPAYAAPLAQTPDINVTLTANPATVSENEVGTDISYTLSIQNQHSATIEIIDIYDDVLGGPTSVLNAGSCPGANALIGFGQTLTCTYTRNMVLTPGTLTNTVTVDVSTGGSPATNTETDDVDVNVLDTQPNFTVTKTPDRTLVGIDSITVDQVTFTVDIQNNNTNESVLITALNDSVYGDILALPAPGSTTCGLPLLAPNGQAGDTYTCTYTIPAQTGSPTFISPPYMDPAYTTGVRTVTSSLTATGEDNDVPTSRDFSSSNVAVRFTADEAELAVVVNDERSARGESVTFTVTVTNNGPEDATNARVEITNIDDDLNYESASATTGSYNSSTGIWSGISITSGNTAELQLSFYSSVPFDPSAPSGPQPADTTSISPAFDATVFPGDQYDDNLANNTDNASLNLVNGVAIAKTHIWADNDGSGRLSIGDSITWIICAENMDAGDAAPASGVPTDGILIFDDLGPGQSVLQRQRAIASACPASLADLAALTWTDFPTFPVNVGILNPQGTPGDVGVVRIETVLNADGYVFSGLMPFENAQPGNGTTNVNDNHTDPSSNSPVSSAVTIQLEPEPFPLAMVISVSIIILAIVYLTIFNLRDLLSNVKPQPVAWTRIVAMMVVLLLAVFNFAPPTGAFAQEGTPETPTDTVEPTDEATEEDTTTPEPSDTPEDDETETPDASETSDVTETPESSETPEETEATETPEASETPEETEASETPEETETPEASETEVTPEATEEETAVPTLDDQLNTPTPTTEATATPTGKEAVGGVIWVDMDEDGAISGGDAPAVNVQVSLYLDNGDLSFDPANDLSIGTKATDAEGAYRFNRLEAGEYWVVVDPTTLPEEALPDQQLAPQVVTAPGVVNFLLVAQTQMNTDFAQGSGRLTGMAFNDNNGNRLWDGDGESGLRYVDVALYFDTGDNVFDPASDQEVARVTTDWDGTYTFDQLGEGRYWVWLDESTLPEHYMDTVKFGNHGIQNPQEVVLSDLPQGIFANARVDVEGPWFAFTLDTDGDGSPDGVEGGGDRDSDGIPNYLDTYDPSGTVYSFDLAYGTGNAVSDVLIFLFVDEGNGVYDGDEPLADVIQSNPQVTGADGAYRFDILVGTANGIPTTGSATFLLVIDEDVLPEGYSFGRTPDTGGTIVPPWLESPTLNVPATTGTYQVSANAYPPNTAGEPYHIAFVIEDGDDEVVNNHIPLTVDTLEEGWLNGTCAMRTTNVFASYYQVCDQEPAQPTLAGTLDATFEPNRSATVGVTTSQTYCHVLTNTGDDDERFTIRFPGGSQGWGQSLTVSTGDCASLGGTPIQNVTRGGSYTTNPISPGTINALYLEHRITPPTGTANNTIDVTTITAESVTDSRLNRTVTDITTSLAGSIEGVIFDDDNLSGIQDIGEADIPGVGVYLFNGLTSVANTTTNSNGEYSFEGIPPGILYYVVLDEDTLNDPDYVSPTTNQAGPLLVTSGTTTTQDFAINVSSTTTTTDPSLYMSVSPTSTTAGSAVTYTLTLTKNSTTPPLTNVVVTVVMNSLLTIGTPTSSQGSASVAQGSHGVYLKDIAAQTTHTVTFTLGTVNPSTTITMTIPATVSSSATAQTIYHTAYVNYYRNSVPQTQIASNQVGLTITTTSAQATATADQANANATSTAAAEESDSSSSGSSSESSSADTLPLTGYVAHSAANNAPMAVLTNILSGIVTTLLVIAGLAIGTWGLLLYFERLPQSFVDRFDWLQSDRNWYAGSIAFTIVITLFIVLQVIAPPMNVQVAEVPGEAADSQAPVDVVDVSTAANRGEQPAAAPNATRHIKPPDPARRLLIPKLEIDTEVVDAQAIGNTWDVSTFKDEAAHLEGTAHLGTLGNAVIAGHVRTEEGLGLFRNMKQLDVGDQIIAQGDNVEYVYEILWVETVDPSEMGVVAPSDEAILTLITCTDWDSASWTYLSRVIVRAKLVEARPIE